MHCIEMKLNWQRLHRFKLYGAHEKFTIKLIVVHIQACGFYGHPFHAIMLFLAWNDTQQHTKCNNIDRVRGTSKYNQLSCVTINTYDMTSFKNPSNFNYRDRSMHMIWITLVYSGAGTVHTDADFSIVCWKWLSFWTQSWKIQVIFFLYNIQPKSSVKKHLRRHKVLKRPCKRLRISLNIKTLL